MTLNKMTLNKITLMQEKIIDCGEPTYGKLWN